MILRMLTIISSAMLLLTSSPMDLVLLDPLGVPYEIAFMVLMAIRFYRFWAMKCAMLTAIQLRA